MHYDLVIRNGSIVDGSGRPRYSADVGVADGRIQTVGHIKDRASTEIDAEAHFVTPGFIDGHTHLDAQFNWDPLATSSCWHGVTSVVMGNCSFGLAPCKADGRDAVLSCFERAEDIPIGVLKEGINWRWETFSEYLDVLDELPKGINVATYVGHSALRTYVMGERAFAHEASEAELARMLIELEAALQAGAVGLSTCRGAHVASDGRPVPSRLANWSEFEAMAMRMSELGGGLIQIDHEKHPRGPDREEYFARLRRLLAESGLPAFYMLILPPDEPEFATDSLAFLDQVATAGGRLYGQVHTRELCTLIGFSTQLPFDHLPHWSQFRRLPLDEQYRRLLDSTAHEQLVREVLERGPELIMPAKGRRFDPAVTAVIDTPFGPFRNVADLALERGSTPVDVMIDLSLATNLRQLFGQMNWNRDLDRVLELLRHELTVVGVSDAGAHFDHISDFSIPTHLLGYWVRTQEAFEWEEAIRMLTAIPADVYGLVDRGRIREGYAADLVIFDPATVGAQIPRVEHDLPSGAPRLTQAAMGIAATVVNGEVVTRHGEHTGTLSGRLLRGSLAAGRRGTRSS